MNKTNQLNLSIRQLVSVMFILFLTFAWGMGGKDPIMYLLYSVSYIVLAILLFTRKTEKKTNSYSKISVLLLFFISISSLSLLWSVNKYETLLVLIPLLLAGFLYVTAAEFFQDKKMIDIWGPLWIASSAILVISSIPGFIKNNIDGRFSGLFEWPNAFAGFIIAPFILSLYLHSKSKSKYSYIYLIASGLFLSSFILTFSRAAYLVMALTVLLLVVTNIKNKSLLKSLFTSFLIGFVLAGGMYFIKNNLFKNTTNFNITSSSSKSADLLQRSVADRKSYWLSSTNMSKDNFLLGNGLGTFKSVYPKYQLNASAETNYPHNYFLEILSELGILGCLVLIAITLYLFKIVFNNQGKLISIVAISSIGILGHSYLDTDMSYPAILFSLIVLLSIV